MSQQKKTPVAVLNDIMTKRLIVPKYELVHGGPGESMFMMQVTCASLPGGDALSAYGSLGTSKQEAKHKAAEAFLKKFCNDEDSTTISVTPTTAFCAGCEMLLRICLKNQLGPPKYTDVCVRGSGQSLSWVVECKISYIGIEGQGKRKSEAREEAAMRMSWILTTIGPISEILKSSKFTKSTTSNEVIAACSNEPVECNETCPANDVLPAETPRPRRRPDIAKELLRLVNEGKVAERMRNSNNE